MLLDQNAYMFHKIYTHVGIEQRVGVKYIELILNI